MRARSLLVVALLTLAGCTVFEKMGFGEGSRQGEFRAQYVNGTLCTDGPCDVKLTVAAGCVVTVDPPTLGIDTRLHDVTIRWTIDPASTGGAAFVALPRHGINPKAGSVVGWRQEFSTPNRVGDTVFTWQDSNRLAGAPRKRKHDYEIEMVQNGRRCHVDPIIINDY